jgi:hypothetical protein
LSQRAEPEIRPALEFALKGSRASGTPFQHVSAAMLAERYFSGRPDGLRPPKNAEELLVATT